MKFVMPDCLKYTFGSICTVCRFGKNYGKSKTLNQICNHHTVRKCLANDVYLIPNEVLVTIYKSCIRPILEYACSCLPNYTYVIKLSLFNGKLSVLFTVYMNITW